MGIRRIAALTVSGGAAAALAFGLAAPADAAVGNGLCESGEWCTYYAVNGNGAMYDFSGVDTNYGSHQLLRNNNPGAGNPTLGQGLSAANNQLSDTNRTSGYIVAFTGANFTGTYGYASPGESGNLVSPYADNLESHYVTSVPPGLARSVDR